MTGDPTRKPSAESFRWPSVISPIGRENIRVYVPLVVAIIGLSIYTGSRNDLFLTWNNFELILLASAPLGILAVGQTLLLVGGHLDLSVGSMVSMTSVIVALLIRDHSLGEVPILVVVLIIGALVGLIYGLIVAFIRVPSFILTLGGLSVISSIGLTLSNTATIGVREGFGSLRSTELLGFRLPVIIWMAVLVVAGFGLHFTRFGRNVFAMGSSEEAAYLSGVPTKLTTVVLFMVNSMLAAVAGVLFFARIGAGAPRGGIGLELTTIAAIVLGGASLAGGRGTILGSFLGVLTLGFVSSSLTFLDVPESYSPLVFGGVLIGAVLITAIAEIQRQRASTTVVEHSPESDADPADDNDTEIPKPRQGAE